MPRPVKSRHSLPGHSKISRVSKPDLDGDFSMQENNAEAGPSEEVEEVVERPITKQKKSDKLYQRNQALLAKITDGVSPYSKSHNKRLKKAARPSEHLVTNLVEVEDVLEEMGVQEEVEEEKVSIGRDLLTGGKGQEKLTAKKRQRVLLEEAPRFSAILTNPSYAAKPWETLRLHTLNSLETMKPKPKPKQQQKKLRSQ